MNPFKHIHEQLLDDAAFLWLLRSRAVDRPNYLLSDVIELERRINAAIDALVITPDVTWEMCEAAFELQQPDTLFVAAVLAFRSLETTKIQQVVEIGMKSPQLVTALASALAWIPERLSQPWVKKFLTSKDLNHKYLAIRVHSLLRMDPGEYLNTLFNRDDCTEHKALYAALLQLAGEVKRVDAMSAIRVAMRSDHKDVLFWSHWAAILLGDKSTAPLMHPFALENNIYQLDALQTCIPVLPIETSRTWITSIAKDPANIRTAIHATAILGDPQAVNWLINQMRIPALGRLAGEAFTTITGIELETNKLALADLPDLEDQLPNEDPSNSNVEMSDDDGLPFPDVDKVAAIWHKYQQRFATGQRYFMGKPLTTDYLQHIYQVGTQRQRKAAALELALLTPNQPLANHAASGSEMSLYLMPQQLAR